MTQTWKTLLAVGIAFAMSAPAWAEPPPKVPAVTKSKKVRQVGSAIGAQVEARGPTAAHQKRPVAASADKEPAPPPRPEHQRAARAERVVAFRAMQPRVTRPEEIPEPVRVEMKLHASRTARLVRIEALAKAGDDQSAIKRTLDLLARERARHHKAMTRLWPTAPTAAPIAPGEEEVDEEGEPVDPDAVDEDEQEGSRP